MSSLDEDTTSPEVENEMQLESGSEPPSDTSTNFPRIDKNGKLARVLRDEPNWLPHIRGLQETEVIIILTPVVVPVEDLTSPSDPFEPLGQSVARRHQRVRQVPYTQRNGITSTHLGFIKRGHVVILCFAIRPGEQIPFEVADITFNVNDDKPCIVIVCCSPLSDGLDLHFPTLIQCSDYSPPALEAAVKLMFGEREASRIQSQNSRLQPTSRRLWPVEEFEVAKDIADIWTLWSECTTSQFNLDQQTLASVLDRPGYAKHYVVRDELAGRVIGFCATYLTFVDQVGEELVAALAVLLVLPDKRMRGIGLSLHSYAVNQLKNTRGVIRIQLGSIYPRIFHGLPLNMSINEEWFRRRGWWMNRPHTYDLTLDFKDWQFPSDYLPNTIFARQCKQSDMKEVIALVESVTTEPDRLGWFDQYTSLITSPNIKDIMLWIEDNTIVAAALTYTPSCGSTIALNLPWANRIGNDVGGVTCVCMNPAQPQSTVIGLLDACIQNLKSQGMKKLYIDGIKNEDNILAQLGFKEWARYQHIWREV